jgi:hypothetical protein
MNSIFQQLGMIRDFVLGILSYSPQTELLQAFQNLLLSLRYKRKGCLSTEALLPYLGGHIDPKEQMDADEFLNIFLTKLEMELEAVGGKDLVEDLFKGKSVTTLTGREPCSHSRTQHQTFLCLSLDIQGKSSILHSFTALTQSETMHGTNMIDCTACGQRMVTESRQQLQHLPNILFISLRRFNYDMKSHKRYKINSYCEFPLDLDLTSVSAETSYPADYYQYRLRGVVVHFGMAEAGHYYCLARAKNGSWLKMDDTVVSEFDLKDLPAEAFGEKDEINDKGASLHIGNSAYMLVYERTGRYHYREQPGPLIPIDRMEGSKAREVEEKYEGKRNMRVKACTLFSREYRYFVAQSSFPPSFLLSYFLTVHLRTKQWWLESDFLQLVLERVHGEALTLGFWLSEILTCEGVLDEFLIKASSVEVKKAFASIIVAAIPNLQERLKGYILYKMLCKMESLAEVVSSDLTTFFEIMWHLAAAVPSYANEIQLAERLICKLLSTPMPPLPPKPPIYSQDAYLGHPLLSYSSSAPPASTLHLGFQLAILSLLHAQLPSPDLWERLWPFQLLCLPTAFEQHKAAGLLVGIQRLPPIGGELNTEKTRDITIGTLMEVSRQSQGRMIPEVAERLIEVRTT